MRVYLDICAIQRPLDTFDQIRIILEAEAVLGIIALCEAGEIEIISSDALIYEIEQNPWPVRQEHARAVLKRAKEVLRLSESVKDRAEQFTEQGLKPLDALHLAFAEAGKVDYFCTCDDRLRQRARRIVGLQTKVVSPLELIEEVQK